MHEAQSLSDDSLWTPADVARYLKASRSWVYEKGEAGILPSLRIGGLLRFDPAEVRAFVRGERDDTVVPFGPRTTR